MIWSYKRSKVLWKLRKPLRILNGRNAALWTTAVEKHLCLQNMNEISGGDNTRQYERLNSLTPIKDVHMI